MRHDETTPVWTPSARATAEAAITEFARFAGGRGGPPSDAPYEQMWRWSVQDTAGFWSAVAEFCELAWETRPDAVTDGAPMPQTRWFPGGRLNYAAQVFRTPRTGPAVVGHDETGISRALSWTELEEQVAGLAATLEGLGVRAGDRVAGYLPDCPEAIVAFLAAASLGAIWAGCGTDLAGDAARARLAQLDPTCLIAAAGHHHRGRWVDRTPDVLALREGLPNLCATVLVGEGHARAGASVEWVRAVSSPAGRRRSSPVPVPAEHPLWVLFTSGTTGPPKGIVHSHAGVVIEHLKTLSLHLDVGPGDQFFWYTTLNWMLWNLRVGGLLRGATVHCFDGAPTARALWEVAERGRITHLGVSPGYLSASRDAGLHPAAGFDLAALRMVGCTGSVLTAPLHRWAAAELGPQVLIGSTTGGTDVVSGFAGSAATVPIRAGEVAVRCLGVDLHAWSADRESLTDEVGELVLTAPMPSMPVGFWGDLDGSRYRAAYFEQFPGVWRHGDWVTVTRRCSVIVHGRSDATLNRHGIRMGSADICQAAEDLPEVGEALVVGIEEPDGGYWMPIFVTLTGGRRLDDDLAAAIRAAVRDRVSPRHVPDEVIQAPGIPHTPTGKKLEVPVKNILRGLTAAVRKDAVDRPELLEFYREAGARRHRMRDRGNEGTSP
ncbi:acetoacetate--CoA ligase [Catenulispora sp. NF23]|uniref:acetoacetate--CoA ligase n=1 Tax=Catenulispora pinistramenti TaxID=2705254 RepID=UPI001BAA8569|nr:acetoacetate--CoA ligase [Catenulispora pinistramenti]MBS2538782.1 acetoacetate--CoA ligase [Catenulispora pinistramenti]